MLQNQRAKRWQKNILNIILLICYFSEEKSIKTIYKKEKPNSCVHIQQETPNMTHLLNEYLLSPELSNYRVL